MFSQIDILVSNAGRSQRAQWENIDTEVDKQLFELNVFSLVALARKVTHHFLATGGGHHVITSSAAGKMGPPFSGSYGASKHALHVSEIFIDLYIIIFLDFISISQNNLFNQFLVIFFLIKLSI